MICYAKLRRGKNDLYCSNTRQSNLSFWNTESLDVLFGVVKQTRESLSWEEFTGQSAAAHSYRSIQVGFYDVYVIQPPPAGIFLFYVDDFFFEFV